MKTKLKHSCKFMKTCTTLDALYPPHKKYSKIKRKFRELILISEENGRKCFAPTGTAGYIYEKEKQLSQTFFIIHPYSKFRQYWEIIALIEFFFAFILRTIVVSQLSDIALQDAFQLSGFFADLFESADVWQRFLIGYMDKEMQEAVLQNRKVVTRTLKSVSFYLDAIVSFPISFFTYKLCRKPNKLCLYVVFFKFTKFYSMSRYLLHQGKIYNWSDLVLRIIWGLYFITIFSHCVACVFYVVISENFINTAFKTKETPHHFFLRHIRIYYIVACLIFTHEGLEGKLFVGTLTDKIFYCCIIIILYFASVTISGLFIQVLAFVKSSRTLYEELKQEVHKFLAQENLPKHVHVKAMKYLEFRYSYCYFNEEIILKTLSPPLRREVMKFLCYELIKRPNSVYNSLPDEMAVDLCLFMKFQYFLPGDVIFKAGSKSQRLYFLYSGSVVFYSSDGKEVIHWYEGQQFGISAFLEKPLHPLTGIALEMTELYHVEFSDFLNVVGQTSKYVKSVRAAALERLIYTRDFFQWENL